MADVIVIGTTPTFIYTFKTISPSDITTAIFTVKSMGQIVIRKTFADAEIGEDTMSFTLSQEETLSIGTHAATAMLNWVTEEGKRGIGKTIKFIGGDNHIREVI